MKKLLLIIVLSLLFATNLFADASTTVSITQVSSAMKTATVTWVGASNGAVTPIQISGMEGWWLCKLETNPGATAPTNSYDIYLYSSDGADVLGGAGADRNNTNTEVTYPIVDSISGQRACVPVTSTLNFAIANQSVDSGNGTAIFTFYYTR